MINRQIKKNWNQFSVCRISKKRTKFINYNKQIKTNKHNNECHFRTSTSFSKCRSTEHITAFVSNINLSHQKMADKALAVIDFISQLYLARFIHFILLIGNSLRQL